ncbi:MAG: flagellar basal body L-ring protein FlgH [Pseudomonadota bacterium]|nr:flagellar basal body L-ring protein FlgH [Xanthomonadaceae bacterium]MDE2247454.1 flagellar basal body L-ring protein FlgH [Xanthomonadaceae bacterium]MDE3209294.1 flagellar basal body L-ring protein FlgH [Pseudomonadota bacterium]
MKPFNAIARGLAIIAWLPLAGCIQPSAVRDDAQWAATAPKDTDTPPPVDGSIYHEAQAMELFSDTHAHRTGDILTIVLQESTQASKKATTSTSKNDSVALGSPTILGQGVTLNGKPVSIGVNGKNAFDGAGSSSQSNQLTGQITVTVARRLSNGNLYVRGEKLLTINQGQELVRISGIVRPQDIAQDNSVPSTRVADAHIEYTGRGSLADANTQGWLARFFNSKWMPF